jgi:hypothetical protein
MLNASANPQGGGQAFVVDDFKLLGGQPTSSPTSSWGQVKTLYR